MEQVAVFVDAGYLFAQGSIALAGKKLPRGRLVLDHERAIEALAKFATGLCGLKLLRIYWYDGTSTGPSTQQITLAHLPNVKVRLGFVNSVGEQKGVDSLIVTDMIALARNHAMSEAVLVSGDEDLRVGVQLAQEFGVRVHLLGVRPSRGSQSLFLLQESDTTHEWGPDDLKPFLCCKPDSVPVAVAAATVAAAGSPAGLAFAPGATAPVGAAAGRLAAPAGPAGVHAPAVVVTPKTDAPTSLDDVASRLAQEISGSELAAVTESIRKSGQIPKEFDGRLLTMGRVAIKTTQLDSEQKRAVRKAFLNACERRLAGR